jgi:hypothetical protein
MCVLLNYCVLLTAYADTHQHYMRATVCPCRHSQAAPRSQPPYLFPSSFLVHVSKHLEPEGVALKHAPLHKGSNRIAVLAQGCHL